MSDTKLIQSVLDKVTSIDSKVDKGFRELKEDVVKNRKRIDKLGLQLAELEDDAPTREEHDELEGRLDKLENLTTPVT
jgi:DNA repair ATPase RecN